MTGEDSPQDFLKWVAGEPKKGSTIDSPKVTEDTPPSAFLPKLPRKVARLSSKIEYICPEMLNVKDGAAGFVRSYAELIPGPIPISDFWWHIYRLTLPIDERTGLPRIIDSNRMQPGESYYQRAREFRRVICESVGVAEEDLARLVGLAGLLENGGGEAGRTVQGNVFEEGISWGLRYVGTNPVTQCSVRSLPGFKEPRKGERYRRPDIVLFDPLGTTPEVVLSLKKSVRSGAGRGGDLTEESEYYRRLASGRLRFCAVTNDFDPGRLHGMLETCDPNGRPSLDALYVISLDLLHAMHEEAVLQRYIDEDRLRDLSRLLQDMSVIGVGTSA
jgi:hypothetical protein